MLFDWTWYEVPMGYLIAGEKFSITLNMSRGEILTILQFFVLKTYGFRDVGSYLKLVGK